MSDYQPPKVWQWEAGNGGKFAGINRPTAGAREQKELPVGKHPLQLYSLATPNGQKVTVMLEELLALGIKEAEYDAWLINIMEGDQFGSDFVAINPNSKIPALMDYSVTPPQPVFESGAILLYLAEKFDVLIPKSPRLRTQCLSWLFWQMGAAPLLGGGFGHFYAYAPEKFKYPIDRYAMEAKRQLDVLNNHFAENQCICGDEYSIADIAIFTWYGAVVRNEAYDAAEFLDAQSYTHLLRWANQIAERPAVKLGRRINKMQGDDAILERH